MYVCIIKSVEQDFLFSFSVVRITKIFSGESVFKNCPKDHFIFFGCFPCFNCISTFLCHLTSKVFA